MIAFIFNRALNLLVIGSSVASLGFLGVLALDTSWSATSERRFEREVDVLLGVQSHDVGGHVNDLLHFLAT